MKQQPLDLQMCLAEKFQSARPLVQNSKCFGMAREFILDNSTLIINFDWAIVRGNLLQWHTAEFENANVEEDGDILRIRYADGRHVYLTNLIAYTFQALREKNGRERVSQH